MNCRDKGAGGNHARSLFARFEERHRPNASGVNQEKGRSDWLRPFSFCGAEKRIYSASPMGSSMFMSRASPPR